MSAIIAAGATVAAGALGKGIYGAVQNHQASQIEKNNIRGVMPVQQELLDNVGTAQQMAGVGLPQQQYLNQLNAINRNQAGGLSQLSRSANPSAGIASIVRAGNDANNNLNAQDAMERNRNTLALIQQRGILANAKQNAWNYNVADKYSENLAKSQALRAAGTQNVAGALNDVGNAGTMLASYAMNNGEGGGGSQTMGQATGTPQLSMLNPRSTPQYSRDSTQYSDWLMQQQRARGIW